MAQSKLAIANLALAKIGSRAITSFTQSGSNEAVAVNNCYNDILDEVLSEHPWTFAQRRVELEYTVPSNTAQTLDDPLTISGATAANPVVITSASHGLSNGDLIKITSVAGMTQLNDIFYLVANVTTNTFELTDEDGVNIDGSAFTAYTSGGYIYKAIDLVVVDTGSVVVYNKPSDMIKPIKKSIKNAFVSIEEDKIISDTLLLKMIYTFRQIDTTKYFPKFTQALATRLAAEIAFAITNSTTKTEALMKLYMDQVLPSAVAVDSTQGTPNEADQDEWLNQMLLGSGGFPITTGETWHPA